MRTVWDAREAESLHAAGSSPRRRAETASAHKPHFSSRCLKSSLRTCIASTDCKLEETPMEIETRTMTRVMVRLVPFLILCYFVAYLDRVNVGFAALQMNQALGFSASAYG